MTMRMRRLIFGGGMAWVLAGPLGAERLLLDGAGVQVTLEREVPCGEPATILVEASLPDLFDKDAGQLQSLVDSARAMLAFECPGLAELEVRGQLKGIGKPVYLGKAAARSNWELEAVQSIRSTAVDLSLGAAVPPITPAREGGWSPDRAVAGLFLGMTVDEARAAVVTAFGAEPLYDPVQGLMTMHSNGCPAGYDGGPLQPEPAAGWKCLEAWFSDERIAKLSALTLIQVVPRDQLDQVEPALIERFGKPVSRWFGQERGAREGEVVHLAWGERIATTGAEAGTPTYELQAVIVATGAVVITQIALNSASRGAQDTGVKVGKPLDLKI